MRRSTRTLTLAADAITVEGALIAPATVAQIAALKADRQSEADYRIPKGLTLRDEIARYFRIGQALFNDLHTIAAPSAEKTTAFVEALVRDVFCFADIARIGTKTVEGRTFAVTLEGLHGRVPIVVVPPNDELDRPSVHLTTDNRRRSAASAVQDWLNTNENALWGMCSNGELLRLLRDNGSLTRPAYIEADLRRIFENDNFADFTALWLLLHSSRFGAPDAAPSDCALEQWREAGQREGLAARDRLRDGVEAALLALGTGFLAHAENGALREQLRTGRLPLENYFGQLLRLVYRLIFLLTAEDRELLHTPDATVQARKLYADGYSVGLLRDRAVRRAAWDQHYDRWEGLLVSFSALARGEPLFGLPALDGLFAGGTVPDLEAVCLSNRALMEAIYRLAWLRETSGLIQVNWRDMETEELGSVYESLLELTPHLIDDGRAMAFAEGGEAKGHARKTTGSYYTPDFLVQALLDSALDPVLDGVEANADDAAEALLRVSVIDPACGSGHFLLAAARRIATRVARVRSGGVASAGDYRHALREVARSCIYGVDHNPMAVELTKVALWIETVEPGKPLGFLDSNIRCGDSLFGIYDLEALRKGIPDGAYKPLTGDEKETAKHFEKRNRAERDGQGSLDFSGGTGKLPPMGPLASEVRAFRALPEDNPAEIALKRARYEAVHSSPRQLTLRIAADLYVAAFLVPKNATPEGAEAVTIPTTAQLWQAMAGKLPPEAMLRQSEKLAADASAFHWPLEFPDIMASGGFDVVIGNPPWERTKLQEVEFFAIRHAEIAGAKTASKRKALVAALADAPLGTFEQKLFVEYQYQKRSSEATTLYCRASQRFPYSARGDLNTYALFTELGVTLLSLRGRLGILVPSGIATESATSALFGYFTEHRLIKSFYDFENRGGFFHGLHTKHKFAAVCVTRSAVEQIDLCFFASNAGDLNDPRKRIALTIDDISLFNPNTKTLPILRSEQDFILLKKLYAVGVPLVDRLEKRNPWGVDFLRMFDMTLDSALFSEIESAESLPLYEAKMFWHFDHRWSDATGDAESAITDSMKADPTLAVSARFYVENSEVEAKLESRKWNEDWLIAYRNVSDSRNERTFVASVIPRCGVGNSATVLTIRNDLIPKAACFLATMNSLVFDYAVRQKVPAMNVNVFMVDQFPFLAPERFTEADCAFINPRVIELVYTSDSIAAFARDLGYEGPVYKWDQERRAVLRAELDAWFTRAYGMTRGELQYILDPADIKGAGYPSETFRVLKKNELSRFGEYRTKRLVLAAWDEMERGEISLPVAASVPAHTLVPINLAALADGAWSNMNTGADATLAQLAALIKALPKATPISHVRLAALYALQPRYLTRHLSDTERAIWRRLVGSSAETVAGQNVSAFTPTIDAGWRSAVTQLRGMKAITEDTNLQTWAAGPNLGQFEIDPLAWPYGRATFVLKALESITLDSATGELPAQDISWVRANAA
jgi:hypothetical protein